jgi:type III pantothenate kinase
VGANLLLFYILSSQISDILSFYHKIKADWTYLCNTMNEIIQCIDAGNTAIKLGVFKQNELQEIQRFDSFETLSKHLSSEYPIVLASVREDNFAMQLKENFSIYEITPQSKTSFHNQYQNNLGADRLCNVAAMYARIKKNNHISGGITVDIGTCVKFDYLDEAFNYVGGYISPGISLRLKSLNDYTARLPLLIAPDHKASLYGNTTSSSIYSGVMGGIKGEIEARIAEFRKLNANMAVFITGGDAHYFDFEQKNGIFADENLTLKGIHEIYVFNALHS